MAGPHAGNSGPAPGTVRTTPEHEETESAEEFKPRKTGPAEPVIDLDEAELDDNFELPAQIRRPKN